MALIFFAKDTLIRGLSCTHAITYRYREFDYYSFAAFTSTAARCIRCREKSLSMHAQAEIITCCCTDITSIVVNKLSFVVSEHLSQLCLL